MGEFTKSIMAQIPIMEKISGQTVRGVALSPQYFNEVKKEAREAGIQNFQATSSSGINFPETIIYGGIKFYEWELITNSICFNFEHK